MTLSFIAAIIMLDETIPVASWIALIAVSGLVLLVLTAWGHVFLSAAPMLRIGRDPVARRAEEFVYGVLGFSVVGFLGVLGGLSLLMLFGAGTVLAAAAWLLLHRRWALVTATAGAPPGRVHFSYWLAPGVVLIGSTIWSIVNLHGLQRAGSSIVFVPWIDFFFHARQITDFANFDGDPATLNAFMYGVRMTPYHYGSYIVPALIVSFGKVPALQVATSLYPVLGMSLTGAAMLVLAGRHGVATGLLAVALLFFVPDISAWLPVGGRWNSYFFFQQVGVGGAYATAAGGMALASALQARADGSIGRTAWAALLLLSIALFKIQILFAFGVFFAWVIVWLTPRIDRRLKIAAMVLIPMIFVALMWVMRTVPSAPTMGLSLDGVRRMLRSPPLLDHSAAALAAFPVAALAVWVMTDGLLLIAVAYFGWTLRSHRAVRSTLLLTGLFLLAQIFVRLLIADNHGLGDPYEINRKTLVWPYYVVCYGAAVLASEWLRSRHPAVLRSRSARRAVVLAGALAVVVTVAAAVRLQQWRGVGEYFTRIEVPAGLLAAAQYLQHNAARGDVVQLCRNDPYNELATLAERPVYIAHLIVNARPLAGEEGRRLAQIGALRQQSDFARAVEAASTLPVVWWVESPDCGTRWTVARTPVFRDAGYSVYHLANRR